jgi:hypothetical protein
MGELVNFGEYPPKYRSSDEPFTPITDGSNIIDLPEPPMIVAYRRDRAEMEEYLKGSPNLVQQALNLDEEYFNLALNRDNELLRTLVLVDVSHLEGTPDAISRIEDWESRYYEVHSTVPPTA